MGCGDDDVGTDPGADSGAGDTGSGDTGSGDTGSGDTGIGDSGGDPCEGLTLCATAGVTCSGDSLDTCAENADGCLVETSMDCGASGGSCDDSGATAMCVADPCATVDVTTLCETDGERVCAEGTLRMCADNGGGCLVFTDTDCEAMPGGVCDDSGDMAMCVLPADPCEGIADACEAEGTSCTDTSLTTCAPNAFGCLVETTADCSERAGGTCGGDPAACMFTGDPCDAVTECETLGSACDGPDLVTCAVDGFGCQVESRTTCTDEMFGFCDVEEAICSTAAVDPCMGMELCDPAGASCTDDSRTLCAANAFGCLTETTSDCAEATDMCNVGSCDPETGDCLVTPVDDGTVCDDGDPETTGETCRAGSCRVDCSVVFITQENQANSTNIGPLFDSVGTMTPVPMNGAGTFSSVAATYEGADVAILHLHDRLITTAEITALTAFLDAGSSVLVTGYDSIGSPTDPTLAGFLGCGTGGDGPFTEATTVVDATHPIAMGPAQTFTMGEALTAARGDHDQCAPSADATQIVAVSTRSKLQILPHSGGGAIMYWNGNGVGSSALDDWEGVDGTQPAWQNLFVNTLTHLCSL